MAQKKRATKPTSNSTSTASRQAKTMRSMPDPQSTAGIQALVVLFTLLSILFLLMAIHQY